jgi:hypothetical protein
MHENAGFRSENLGLERVTDFHAEVDGSYVSTRIGADR